MSAKYVAPWTPGGAAVTSLDDKFLYLAFGDDRHGAGRRHPVGHAVDRSARCRHPGAAAGRGRHHPPGEAGGSGDSWQRRRHWRQPVPQLHLSLAADVRLPADERGLAGSAGGRPFPRDGGVRRLRLPRGDCVARNGRLAAWASRLRQGVAVASGRVDRGVGQHAVVVAGSGRRHCRARVRRPARAVAAHVVSRRLRNARRRRHRRPAAHRDDAEASGDGSAEQRALRPAPARVSGAGATGGLRHRVHRGVGRARLRVAGEAAAVARRRPHRRRIAEAGTSARDWRTRCSFATWRRARVSTSRWRPCGETTRTG